MGCESWADITDEDSGSSDSVSPSPVQAHPGPPGVLLPVPLYSAQVPPGVFLLTQVAQGAPQANGAQEEQDLTAADFEDVEDYIEYVRTRPQPSWYSHGRNPVAQRPTAGAANPETRGPPGVLTATSSPSGPPGVFTAEALLSLQVPASVMNDRAIPCSPPGVLDGPPGVLIATSSPRGPPGVFTAEAVLSPQGLPSVVNDRAVPSSPPGVLDGPTGILTST